MAKNTGSLKRTKYRYIRDGVKSNYVKQSECECCGTTEDLELHHPHTLSLLFDEWCEKNNLKADTLDEVMAVRDDFYKEHWEEVVTDVFTLCNKHHKALHKVYGSQPPLTTAEKQRGWVKRIRDKQSGKESQLTEEGYFSKFATKRFTSFQ